MFVFQLWMWVPVVYGLTLVSMLGVGLNECRSWKDLRDCFIVLALLALILIGPQLLVAWLVLSSPTHQLVKVLT